jgi:hypothetical protein
MCQHAPSAERKTKRTRALKNGTCQNQNPEQRLLSRHLHASAKRVRFNLTMLVDTDSSRENAASGKRATGTLPGKRHVWPNSSGTTQNRSATKVNTRINLARGTQR